jgi:hypothetical protein
MKKNYPNWILFWSMQGHKRPLLPWQGWKLGEYIKKQMVAQKMRFCLLRSHMILFCKVLFVKIQGLTRAKFCHLFPFCSSPWEAYYKLWKHVFSSQVSQGQTFFKKHWYDNSNWGMLEILHIVIMQAIKLVVHKSNYVVLSCDEVMSIGNQSRLSIHVYII